MGFCKARSVAFVFLFFCFWFYAKMTSWLSQWLEYTKNEPPKMARPLSQWLKYTRIYANGLINCFCEAVVCVSRLGKTARSHGDVLFFSSGKPDTFPGMRFRRREAQKRIHQFASARLGSPRARRATRRDPQRLASFRRLFPPPPPAPTQANYA